ncbi:MAG TPA: ATP-binding protein [Acidimicrobiales bacterium]|nr:ATP-binding protein [Acidimicrobiales bacterium]
MDRRARGESEAVERLEMLLVVSRALSRAVDTYDEALQVLVDTCVPTFADLCAIEMVGADGRLTTAAFRRAADSPLTAGATWEPIGAGLDAAREPLLSFEGNEPTAALASLRATLGADSVIAAPIAASGVTIGWVVVAASRGRRGFRPSAARVVEELSTRIATTVQRVSLYRATLAAADAQARTARQLRRLGAASANLAGAEDREAVLRTACTEACMVLDVPAAAAEWRSGDGTVVSVSVGDVDDDGYGALAATLARRSQPRGAWHGQVVPCPDPADRAAMVVAGPLDDDSATLLGSLAAIVPVAFERAATTDAAAEQERRLQAVLDASPVALVTTDARGGVRSMNPAASTLFGWAATRSPDWPDGIGPAMAAVVASSLRGDTVGGRAVRVDGFDLMVSAAPFPGAGGEAAIVAAVDLRAQRAAERALLQAQRLEAIGQVAGGVAHDFNNRLTVITGYASILGRTLPGEAERAMVAAIERAADDAAQLTRRLLGLTRPGSDDATCVDLVEVCTGLEEVLARIVGAGVALRVDVPDHPVAVNADANEMEQVVLNLAINAFDAMEGSGRLTIEVRRADLGGEAAAAVGLVAGSYGCLVVRDDGPGMSEEVLSRCLEPFFTTKDRSRGSGLGLSTIHATVTQRGGHVGVESAPGQGTCVTVVTPAATAAATAAPAGAPPGETPPLPPGTCVLLVEDEQEVRDLAARTLEAAGATVVAVGDGTQALAEHRPGRFTVVVTDVVMPGMTGAELADRLGALEPGLPVLFVTGYAASDSGRLRRLPRGRVLSKPYRPADLVARLASLVGG